MKRVIATEGETVQFKANKDPVGDPKHDSRGCGVYHMNRVKLERTLYQAEPGLITSRPMAESIPCPERSGVFVMGDNRRNSSNTHIFPEHAITVESIVGTAFVSYWPQDHWGLLPHPTYAEIKQK